MSTLILLGSQRTSWGVMRTLKFIHHIYQQENSDRVKHKQNRNPNSQNNCYVDIKMPVRYVISRVCVCVCECVSHSVVSNSLQLHGM